MRIISKFHDYYDVVMKQGMDREVVYVRDTTEVVIPETFELGYRNRYYDWRRKEPQINHYLLGYCGQILFVTEKIYRQENAADIKTFEFSTRLTVVPSKKRKWWYQDRTQLFFEQDLGKALELFHKYQVPLFLIKHNEAPKKQSVILNPCLKDMDFHKYKDVYTTYQDIFQFVAGTLNRPENKMVQISDKDKIAKHGFNKWSFRKPGKKGMD